MSRYVECGPELWQRTHPGIDWNDPHNFSIAWHAARSEALREAAELSPNDLHISAAALPHTVWGAYSNELRAMADREIKQ